MLNAVFLIQKPNCAARISLPCWQRPALGIVCVGTNSSLQPVPDDPDVGAPKGIPWYFIENCQAGQEPTRGAVAWRRCLRL